MKVKTLQRLFLPIAAFTLLLLPTMMFAQTSPPMQKAAADSGPPVEFEVATIKPSAPSGGPLGFTSFPGGRLEIGAGSLTTLLAYAFNVHPFQIKGGPDWAGSDRYDLIAKPAIDSGSGAKPSAMSNRPSRQQRMALQKLLVERFALKFHVEKRQGPVYILTRGAGPLRMQPAKDGSGLQGAGFGRGQDTFTGEVFGMDVTIGILASVMGADLDRPVIDQTGLTGNYDFRLPAFDSGNTDIAAAIFKDMELLGLKMKPGKGLVETVVIDSVQRPTPN